MPPLGHCVIVALHRPQGFLPGTEACIAHFYYCENSNARAVYQNAAIASFCTLHRIGDLYRKFY